MDIKMRGYIVVFPVLCAVAVMYLGPKLNLFTALSSSEDGMNLNSENVEQTNNAEIPKGHMEYFGRHVEKEEEAIELDHFPDPETFYRDFVYPAVPVIVRGGLKHLPAMQKWKDQEYLRKAFGHCLYTIRKRVVDEHHPAEMLMPLGDFLDQYQDQKLYLISYLCPEMTKDISVPSCIGCDAYIKMIREMILFMNSGWTNTEIHIDPYDTFFTQVQGQRRWVLTPPSDGKYLYTEEFPWHAGMSPADADAVDLLKYPKIAKAAIYNFTINEGDVLYVPEAYFHQVRTIGEGTNIGLALYLNYAECVTRCPDTDDIEFLQNCIEARKQNPKEITCKERIDNMTYSELIEKFKDVHPPLGVEKVQQQVLVETVTSKLNNGRKMPTLGLNLAGLNKDQLESTVRNALRIGYRFFITDPNEDSSVVLRSALTDNQHCKREDVFIAVKVDANLDGDAVRKLIQRTLGDMKTDYIDLILFQSPVCDSGQNDCEVKQEAWEALEEFYETNVIQSLGLSRFEVPKLKQIHAASEAPISVVHANFDLTMRNKEMRDFCDAHEIRFMARNIFGSAKIESIVLNSESVKVAARKSRTDASTIVLRWALDKNVTVLPRPTDLERMAFNKRALLIEVDPYLMEDLDTFPHVK